jgi:hypothetical protein
MPKRYARHFRRAVFPLGAGEKVVSLSEELEQE